MEQNKKSSQTVVAESEDVVLGVMKTPLQIDAKVSSFEEGNELLLKLETLKNNYELTIKLNIEVSHSLFQANFE